MKYKLKYPLKDVFGDTVNNGAVIEYDETNEVYLDPRTGAWFDASYVETKPNFFEKVKETEESNEIWTKPQKAYLNMMLGRLQNQIDELRIGKAER